MKKDLYYDEVSTIVKDLAGKCTRLKDENQRQLEDCEIEKKKILLSMVELADDFERLFSIINPKLDDAEKQARKWTKNFNTIYKSLIRKLQLHNVLKMNIIIGDDPHPTYHKIIETEFSSDHPNDTILRVEVDGYLWGKKVLREAEIIVVKNY